MFWVSSDLNSGKKVRVFHFGVGMFWVNSDLNSGKKVRVFHFRGEWFWVAQTWTLGTISIGGGGVLWNQILEQGCSREFGQQFLEA